jgi:hypothetical protein
MEALIHTPHQLIWISSNRQEAGFQVLMLGKVPQ